MLTESIYVYVFSWISKRQSNSQSYTCDTFIRLPNFCLSTAIDAVNFDASSRDSTSEAAELASFHVMGHTVLSQSCHI